MAAPKKRTQSTISKTKVAKQGEPWTRDFRFQFRIRGVREINNDALEYLAGLMLTWIQHSENLYDIRAFLCYQNILKDHLGDFQARCPKLDNAVKATYQRIAYNRERNALAKDPSGTAFKHMQGVYDPEWKAQEIYFNQLRQQVAEKTGSGMKTPVLPSVNELGSMANEHDQAQRRREDLAKELSAEILPGTDTKSPGTETL